MQSYLSAFRGRFSGVAMASQRPGRSSLMSMRTFIDTVVMFFESPLHVEDFPLCDSLLNVWIVDSKTRTCSLIVSRVSQEGAKSQLTRIPRAVQPSCNLKAPKHQPQGIPR